jgi:hypothetical protein
MADIRFTIDHHQLRLVAQEAEQFLNEHPYGEVQSMLHSILGQVMLRLRRRLAEHRLEYKLILPVYQAIALRRIIMAGLELTTSEVVRTELRLVLTELDPKLSNYIHATP